MSIGPPTDPPNEEEYNGDGPYDDEEWLAQQRKDQVGYEREELNRMKYITETGDEMLRRDVITALRTGNDRFVSDGVAYVIHNDQDDFRNGITFVKDDDAMYDDEIWELTYNTPFMTTLYINNASITLHTKEAHDDLSYRDSNWTWEEGLPTDGYHNWWDEWCYEGEYMWRGLKVRVSQVLDYASQHMWTLTVSRKQEVKKND